MISRSIYRVELCSAAFMSVVHPVSTCCEDNPTRNVIYMQNKMWLNININFMISFVGKFVDS
jgi:hypothetical protein